MSSNTDHWIEMQPFEGTTVRIELKRNGKLWHAEAARLAGRDIERQILANAVGVDFEVVRHEILQRVARSLKH